MKARKIDVNRLVGKVQRAKAEARKANVTYRLTSKVVGDFKAACRRQRVLPGAVIEEFMRHFTGGGG